MNILLELPEVVEKYAPHFEDLFSEAGYQHFKRILSGFMVGSNHTLDGINKMFLDAPNQSSLNRFVNRQNFSLEQINTRRVEMMQASCATRIKPTGCLSVDGSLLHHWGRHFDGIYNLWDHVTKSYGMAHDLVTLYYADEQTDYPLDYCLWSPPNWAAVAAQMKALNITLSEKKSERRHEEPKMWLKYISDRYRSVVEKHQELRQTYESKVHLAENMLRAFVKTHPHYNLPVVLDSGFSSSYLFTVMHEQLGLDYVSDITYKRKLHVGSGEYITGAELITRLKAQHYKQLEAGDKTKLVFKKVGYRYRGEKKTAYVYSKVHKLQNHHKKHKVIIHYYNEKLEGEPRITVTNVMSWSPSNILRLRRLRWPVETYHQQAKSHGLESYQVRNEPAIATHIAFVIVAYTMMTKATRDEELLKRLQQRIQTEADPTLSLIRRLLQSSAMWTMGQYIYQAAQNGQQLEEVMRPILTAMAAA